MKPLHEADGFGSVDADNDELLLQAFEDHEAFLDVLAGKRFLIVGKKGSGKTAIFKKLLTISEPDYFCFGHTFSDYPWHYHDRQARLGIPDFDKYTHSWKYLILLTAAKIILNQDQSLPHDDAAFEALARVERFVIDTYGSRDPDVTQIFTPTKTLKLKPHFELDWKLLKAGISPEQVPMDDLPTIVQEVNANLLSYVVGCLNPSNRYFIAFDQLDLGFDPKTPEYASRLIGLLLACRDINIAARQANKQLFVVVFLRDDIYDTLQFEDKNKVTENFLSLIEWDTPRTSKTLQELMEKRFASVLGSTPDERVAWHDVFDESKEMPGHQTKYRHILDRTYLRPRDMIKFVNVVLKTYRARVKENLGADHGKFENPDLHNARPEYSDYLLAELDDEIHKHIPKYHDYLELIRALGVWQFTSEEFADVHGKRAGADLPDVTTILSELYHYSLIGFYRPGGRGYGGSEYVFRYKEPRTRFDPTSTRFRVHTGLIDVLGLKRFSTGETTEAE